MVNYINIHKRNIISETTTSRSNIEAGQIVRFSYTGKDVHDPRPLVLVLNSS